MKYYDLLGLKVEDAGNYTFRYEGQNTGLCIALDKEKAPSKTQNILEFITDRCKRLNIENKDGEFNQIPFISSSRKIASEFSLTQPVVQRALKHLEEKKWITAQKKQNATAYTVNVARIREAVINRKAEPRIRMSERFHPKKEKQREIPAKIRIRKRR